MPSNIAVHDLSKTDSDVMRLAKDRYKQLAVRKSCRGLCRFLTNGVQRLLVG